MTYAKNNIFTWNDLVIIKSSAPNSYYPGKIAVICGMERVKSQKLSEEYNIHIGNWLYTIEFGDGRSINIPEEFLEKYSDF